MIKKTLYGPFLSASVAKTNDGLIHQVDKVKGNLGQFLSSANLNKSYFLSDTRRIIFVLLHSVFTLRSKLR